MPADNKPTPVPDDESAITLGDVLRIMRKSFDRLDQKTDGLSQTVALLEQKTSGNVQATNALTEAVQRLDQSVEKLDRRTDANTTAIQGLQRGMQQLQTSLTARMDALEEDLTATMRDTLMIRKRVGMRVDRD